jgi:hypothetical protein
LLHFAIRYKTSPPATRGSRRQKTPRKSPQPNYEVDHTPAATANLLKIMIDNSIIWKRWTERQVVDIGSLWPDVEDDGNLEK